MEPANLVFKILSFQNASPQFKTFFGDGRRRGSRQQILLSANTGLRDGSGETALHHRDVPAEVLHLLHVPNSYVGDTEPHDGQPELHVRPRHC